MKRLHLNFHKICEHQDSEISVVRFPRNRECYITRATILQVILLFSVFSFVTTGFTHGGIDPEIHELSEKLAQNPDDVKLLMKRAWNYRMNNKHTNALADIEHALELEPDNQEILLQRGLSLSSLNRDTEAEFIFSDFLDKVAAQIPGEMLDRIMDTTTSRVSTKTSDKVLLHAALVARAKTYKKTNQFMLAIDDFTSAITINPSTQLYVARGEIQESLGFYDQAAEGYREGLSRVGGSLQLKEALIRVEIERQQYKQVLNLIDQELVHPSGKSDWHLRRAQILDLMGKKQASQKAKEKALTEATRTLRKRTTALNRVSRAKVYMALGQRPEAKRDLEIAVQMAPNLTKAKELLGVINSQKP